MNFLTFTEVVQQEAALVRGPQLEALGTKVHGHGHDGGTGAPEHDTHCA